MIGRRLECRRVREGSRQACGSHLGEDVRAAAFGGGGVLQQEPLGERPKADHALDARRARRQGAGLVEHHLRPGSVTEQRRTHNERATYGVDAGDLLEGVAALDDEAVPGGQAQAAGRN